MTHSPTKRLRVKLLAKCSGSNPEASWTRFLPHESSETQHCHFLFDPKERNYDWLVVYDDLPALQLERFTQSEEVLACSRSNTLLITTEPPSIKTYGSAYPQQFGHVLTSQEPWAIHHPHRIYSQPALIWFYGKSWNEIARSEPLAKQELLSTVCSSKQQKHTLHHHRYEFTRNLQDRIEAVDVYGRGVRPLAHKADALDPYRYHLAIENHSALHHWTEKLADSFLGCTLPFYYGCTNVEDYFPEESFISVRLFDREYSIELIQESIANREYEKRLPAIREARRRIMEDYGIFSVIDKIVAERHRPEAKNSNEIIQSRHAWRRTHRLGSVKYGFERLRTSWRARKYNRSLVTGA